MQRSAGLFGSLIVHQPKDEDTNAKYYDFDLSEHHLVICDWVHKEMESFEPGVFVNAAADSILANGRGSIPGYNGGTSTVFCVKPATRYRFRCLNAGSYNCPAQITVCILINRRNFLNSKSVNNNLFAVWK